MKTIIIGTKMFDIGVDVNIPVNVEPNGYILTLDLLREKKEIKLDNGLILLFKEKNIKYINTEIKHIIFVSEDYDGLYLRSSGLSTSKLVADVAETSMWDVDEIRTLWYFTNRKHTHQYGELLMKLNNTTLQQVTLV